VAEYALPDCTHYVWPAEHTLGQSITNATKTALGLDQRPIDALGGDVWLFHYTGPHVKQNEYNERDRILNAYPVSREIALDDNQVAHTTVWQVEVMAPVAAK